MKRLFALAAVLASSLPADAAIIRTGSDPDGSATNSNAAFAQWQADVGGTYQTETFDTLSVAGNFLSASTANGNSFAAVGANLFASNFTDGVIVGANLEVDRNAASGGFTWTFANPVNAFGFFGYEHDGGTITINFNDGTAQQFTTGAVDSFFWGISGLNAPISSVTITTNDPGGISNFDNLVTANAAQVAPVPEPATLALFGVLAAGAFGVRRRKAKATA